MTVAKPATARPASQRTRLANGFDPDIAPRQHRAWLAVAAVLADEPRARVPVPPLVTVMASTGISPVTAHNLLIRARRLGWISCSRHFRWRDRTVRFTTAGHDRWAAAARSGTAAGSATGRRTEGAAAS